MEFSDLEPQCVWQPTLEDNGLQIGRANEGVSYFAIIMWISPHDDHGKICFSIDFMPDPVAKVRFESAMFSVTFSEDPNKDGHSIPLNVRDMFPKYEEEVASYNIDHDEQMPDNDEPADDYSLYSFTDENQAPRDSEGGALWHVKGQGLHSPTAVWSFTEDQTTTVRRGLDAHYKLFVSLPARNTISMKFWGKAALVKGNSLLALNKWTSKIGSKEAPYERSLGLNTY